MAQNEHEYNSQELQLISDFILENQHEVLDQWKQSVTHYVDRQTSVLATLSQQKFYDNIPRFLQKLRDNLQQEGDPKKEAEEIGKLHGEQRWEHGLDLKEVVQEWSLLHLILMDLIEQSVDHISVSAASLGEAQKRLTRYIHRGILGSVDAYYNLQSLEAEGQLRDLETVVQEEVDLKEKRTQSLKEASHDLKGSMTAITMNLYLLERADLNDDARRLVKKLSQAADSLTMLLQNLLDLSRLEAGREERKIGEFDVSQLLTNLSNSMQPMARAKELELRTEGEESLQVRGDRLKVQRIAQNILLNAVKYTEEGHISVNWKNEKADQWQLIITDTGPGFATSNADALTKQPSKQEDFPDKIQVHSEGVGLIIVRKLCVLLDAVLEIKSEPGAGTTVQVTFPTDYPDE